MEAQILILVYRIREDHPNYRRTTDSSGVIRFDNLLTDLEIIRINQVWQSDKTYYDVSNKTYYLTFILDAYSRVIVGYYVSLQISFFTLMEVDSITIKTFYYSPPRIKLETVCVNIPGKTVKRNALTV
ncbi:MAG: integrase core domain protein [Bacteroidetes bacterium]|nr:integrase core domain protein [Bacteroidota bacterium]